MGGASNFTGACPGCRQCASENGWCSETLPCCDADARCESLLGGSGATCVKQSSGCVAEGAICGGHGMLTQQCCGDHQCQWQGDKMRCITVDTQCALENSWCSDTLPCCDADARCESLLGGSGAKCVKQSSGSMDTPDWNNGFQWCSYEVPQDSGTKYCTSEGWTCEGYEWKGWCKDGRVYYGGGAEFNYPENNCCACGKQCGGDTSLSSATLSVSNVSNKSMDTVLSPEAQIARPSLQGASNFTASCPGCRQCASESDWCSETLPCCDSDARCESLLGGSGAKCVKQSSGSMDTPDWNN